MLLIHVHRHIFVIFFGTRPVKLIVGLASPDEKAIVQSCIIFFISLKLFSFLNFIPQIQKKGKYELKVMDHWTVVKTDGSNQASEK